MNIKELITKEHMVAFNSYRAGFFYYDVYNINKTPTGPVWQFTVPLDDVGGATLSAHDKAITFMRWIRKAIENNELTPVYNEHRSNKNKLGNLKS